MTGTRVRLFGIDAPEARQTCEREGARWDCGEDAVQHLRSLVSGLEIECRQQDKDRYGRIVATCYAAGRDLARSMVNSGLATALPQFSEAYVFDETYARQAKIGLWNSSFQHPADWRAANPSSEPKLTAPRLVQRSAPTRSSASSRTYKNSWGCAIKGNRNRKGQWIYHLPGMPYYEATRAEEFFCTEEAAAAAGYRRAIVR